MHVRHACEPARRAQSLQLQGKRVPQQCAVAIDGAREGFETKALPVNEVLQLAICLYLAVCCSC